MDVSTAFPANSFRYLLFGLCVETNRPLDWLIAAPVDHSCDLRIELDSLPGNNAGQRAPERLWYASQTLDAGVPLLQIWSLDNGGGCRLQFSDGGEFLCDPSGSRIVAHGRSPDDLTTHLYGPVMSFIWLLRGRCCLHASAVVIDGRAAVFLGPPGSGKSTTAALFASQGYEVLTDDLAVLALTGVADDRWTISSSYPRLQLRASSNSVINRAMAGNLHLQATTDRDWYDLDLRSNRFQFREEPADLAAVYLLEPDLADGPFLQRLSPREALMALIANSWTARVLDPATRQREFEQLSQLASRVSLRRVLRIRHSGSPAAFCEALVDDFRALAE